MNSIDSMLKSAFQYELINQLGVLPLDEVNADILTVREYLKKRISELSKE